MRSTSSRRREGRVHTARLGRLHALANHRPQHPQRINRLIDDVRRDPVSGIGKPEQLRHALSATWSRRITEEHRLVYLVDGDDLVILQARFYYE